MGKGHDKVATAQRKRAMLTLLANCESVWSSYLTNRILGSEPQMAALVAINQVGIGPDHQPIGPPSDVAVAAKQRKLMAFATDMVRHLESRLQMSAHGLLSLDGEGDNGQALVAEV